MEGEQLQHELLYHRGLAERIAAQQEPVSPRTIERYAASSNWRYFEKEAVFHHLRRFAEGKEGVRVCEFGCGEGVYSCQVALIFSGAQVVGIDISPELIAAAQRNAELNGVSERVSFTVADAEHCPIEEGSIDAMLVLNILHHTDLDQVLPQIDRTLKKDGVVIILEPVAFSRTLQQVRDLLPIRKDVTPDERQLSRREVDLIANSFRLREARYFHLFGRLARLIPEFPGRLGVLKLINAVDAALFTVAPFLKRYAGRVLIVAGKKLSVAPAGA